MSDFESIQVLTAPADASPPDWHLLAVGDVYICDAIPAATGAGPSDETAAARDAAQRFDPALRAVIGAAELSVVNLEGPTCANGTEAPKSGPSLRMPPHVPRALRMVGFDVATLANNHVMDFGAVGLRATLEECRRAGLATCGAGETAGDARRPLRREPVPGVRVSLIALCEREFGAALDGTPGGAWISDPAALACVAQARRESDVVIVSAHGGVECAPLPPPQRREQLRRLVDAGAALVIGHHPHVPQGWERHGEGMIFYSLGDCLFDRPGSERMPRTEWGLALRAGFAGPRLASIELVFLEQRDGRVRPLRDAAGPRDYLRRVAELTADAARSEAAWQEVAGVLLEARYRPLLRQAVRGGAARGIGGTGILARATRRLRRRAAAAAPDRERPTIGDPLLLLNLVRNESHRWALETALGVATGDVPDLRTPDDRRIARELLAWTTEETSCAS